MILFQKPPIQHLLDQLQEKITELTEWKLNYEKMYKEYSISLREFQSLSDTVTEENTTPILRNQSPQEMLEIITSVCALTFSDFTLEECIKLSKALTLLQLQLI